MCSQYHLIQLNVVAFTSEAEGIALAPERPQPWVEVVPQQELLEKFQDWGNDATLILKRMNKPSRWSIHTLYPPLKSFVYGRVVLIGDAVRVRIIYILFGVDLLPVGACNGSSSGCWGRTGL